MKILSLESPVGKFLSKIFDLAILNLLFLLTCIPVVTIGASVTALYTITLKMVRDEEGALVKGYFAAFCGNLKKATLCFVPMLAVIAVMLWNLYWYVTGYLTGHGRGMELALLAGLLLVYMLGEWAFVWQARFANTVREIWHNAVFFTVRYFLRNLIFTALTLLWVYFMVFFPQLWIVGIFFAFSLPAYLKSLFYRGKLQPFEEMALQQGMIE